VSRPPARPQARYGAEPVARRRALLAGVAVVTALFLGWVAWAAWFHATPEVTSELVGFEIVDSHAATATVEVDLSNGADARCLVRATSEDHVSVGELSWVPEDGRNAGEIRTEREATSVSLVGCTTDGQQQPR
jgi:hypothetical protein